MSSRKKPGLRPPASAGLVILIALLLTGLAVGYLRFRAPALRAEALAVRQRQADGLAYRLSLDLTTAEQLASTGAVLARGLRGDATRAEETLLALVGSAASESVYGAGYWYLPHEFDADTRYFGPYVHRDRAKPSGLVLTYEWCTEEYDYPTRPWFAPALDAVGSTTHSEPYFDTDYVYVTTARAIVADDGRPLGAATVGMVVPTLRETVAAVSGADEHNVFVTTAKGAVVLHPCERELLEFARAHYAEAASIVDVGWATMRAYDEERGRGDWPEVTAQVEPVDWTVHVVTEPTVLLEAVGRLKRIVGAVVGGVWLLALLAASALTATAEQARRARRRSRELSRELGELREAQEALRHSEERFRAIFDNASVGIFLVENPERYARWNERWAEMLGVPIDRMVNQQPTAELHPSIRASGQAVLARMLDGQIPSFRVGGPCLRADGENFWVDLLLSTLPGSEPGRRTILGVAVDITAAKRAEEERLEMARRLTESQRLESIGVLAGGVAHDFNNILGAIIGYTELARDGLAEDSPEHEMLDGVLQAAERARDLIRQILTFSRRTEIEPRPVRLPELLHEVLSLVRASLPATIAIEREIRDDCPPVLADPTQLHQVVMNLCANAGQAIGAGGGTIRVDLGAVDLGEEEASWLGLAAAGPHARISVHDTGPGMSAATRERIFEPFFTTKSVGEGTGLGLSTAHGIVRSHGGAIEVASEPGAGTTFTVYLPCIEDEAPAAAPETGPLVEGEGRVLLVDDDVALAGATARMLSILGYEVTECHDAPAALELIAARPQDWDVIVTDLTMPKATGYEIAARARACAPQVPVVLISGVGASTAPPEVGGLGVARFLAKPYTVRQLGEALRDARTRAAARP